MDDREQWVTVRELSGMAVDHMADLDIAELESAGIPARRIPPTNVGTLVPANIRIRILVPRRREEDARVVLDAQPEEVSDTGDRATADGTPSGRDAAKTVFKWLVIAGGVAYLGAQLWSIIQGNF
jgi:hypothetical protein